jgi:hypothetical protein
MLSSRYRRLSEVPLRSALLCLLAAMLFTPLLGAAAPGAARFTAEKVEFDTESPAVDPPGKAVLAYPVVASGVAAALRDKVNELIGPKKALGQDIPGLRAAFASGEHPFDTASARVIFNRSGLLQVEWKVRATGAYTSESRTIVNVDLETGTDFGPGQMFKDGRKLARFLDARARGEVAVHLRAAIDANPEEAALLREMTADLEYTPDMLPALELREDGAVFPFPFGFPHALKAMEPAPVILRLTWKELRPFLSGNSLLLRLAGTSR